VLESRLNRKNKGSVRRSGFFLFASFSFFRRAVEMWKTPRADGALVTNKHFDQVMVNRRRSSQSQSGEQMHTQMVSCEDSAIRNASFSGDVGERVQK
jgi:hypothetical protein